MNTHSHNSKRFLISYTTSQYINLAWKESSLKDWSAKSPCSWAWFWIKESSQEDDWFCIYIYIHTYHINSYCIYIYTYIHNIHIYIHDIHTKKHYMQRKVCRANQTSKLWLIGHMFSFWEASYGYVKKKYVDPPSAPTKNNLVWILIFLDKCRVEWSSIEHSYENMFACCGNNNGLKLRTLPGNGTYFT